MSLANKTFKNNKTGDILKVIDSFENIAILENKQKMNVSDLTNEHLFTEQIDPSNFFNNQGAYNILADKIKNIPTDMIRDEDGSTPLTTINIYDDKFRPATNDSAIIYANENDERQELIKKYGVSESNQNALEKQNMAFQKLLGDDEEITPPVQSIKRPEVNPNPVIQKQEPVEDPIISMFKRAKRTTEFSVELEIVNKLPRLDFIEMMEDSYDVSMIDYLAQEFTQEIILNPDAIKQTIKDKIEQLVYKKKTSDVNPQITDSVTIKPPVPPADTKLPTKPKTTRKPRLKKETTKND
jgi:hypothetical protein